MNVAVTTSVRVASTSTNDITGSTGIVANLVDGDGLSKALFSLDWDLCAHLNTLFVGENTSLTTDLSRTKRTTPQMRENLREVTNILKGVCQVHLNQALTFDKFAFRGDGQLRTPYWKAVLSSSSFRSADEHFMRLELMGVGSGTLSIHRCS